MNRADAEQNAARRSFTMRWVGSQVQANGGSASSSMSSQTAPVMSGNVKTIPCIVVSPETSDDECQGFDWDDTKKNDEGVMDNSSNQGDNNGGIVDCNTPLMGSTHSQSGGKTMPNIIMSSKDDPKLVWEVKSTDQAYPIIINNSLRKNVLEKQDNVQRTPDSVDDDSNAQTESTTFVQPPPQDIVRRHSIPPNVMDRRNSYTSISDP